MSGMILQEASNAAAETMKTQGLWLPEQPDIDIPRIPTDITEMSDEALMTVYTLLVAWTDFAATQAACAAIDERSADRAADIAEARVLGEGASKGTSVSSHKARAASDPYVVKLREAAEVAHHYRKLVETMRDNLDRNYALLSRELTRRTSTDPRSRKDRFTT